METKLSFLEVQQGFLQYLIIEGDELMIEHVHTQGPVWSPSLYSGHYETFFI